MPTEPVQLNLSRALKLKNRLAQRLGQLDALLIKHNSSLEDSQEFDARELYATRTTVAAHLVTLKTAINHANQPIQKAIFELAELKSLITTLNKVDTKHGSTLEGFASTKVTYVAQIRKTEIDREVKRIEREIDRIQDDLDLFNYNTRIAIDPAMLATDGPETGLVGLVGP